MRAVKLKVRELLLAIIGHVTEVEVILKVVIIAN